MLLGYKFPFHVYFEELSPQVSRAVFTLFYPAGKVSRRHKQGLTLHPGLPENHQKIQKVVGRNLTDAFLAQSVPETLDTLFHDFSGGLYNEFEKSLRI